MKKLSNLFVYFSIVVFSFVLLLYLFTNNFIWFIVYFALCILISNSKIKCFGLLMFFVSFFIRLVTIIVFDFPQVYDFKTLLDASHMFSRGDYSFNQWWHFYTWGYQTGFVIYQGILLKLFGSEFFLKILNVIYSSLMVLFIYKVSLKISDSRSAKIVSLLYMIFPFYVFMNTILVNQHLATLLMYLGILFLIKKDKTYKDYIFSAILISFGNIIRPEGIIVVLSLLVYEFFLFDKTKVLNTIVRVSSFLLVYFSIGLLASNLVISSGINSSGLKNKDPLWKFILGFNYDTCGYYSDSDSIYQIDRKTEISIIKERAFGDLSRTGSLMVCKINHFWLSSDLGIETGSFSDKSVDVLGISVAFDDIFNSAVRFNSNINIFVLVMFFIGILFVRKNISNQSLFFLIMIILSFFIFLFIEIQPRYLHFIHVSLFILSSIGIKFLFDFIKNIDVKNIFKKVL